MKPPKVELTCSDVMCMATTLTFENHGLNEAGDAVNMSVKMDVKRMWLFTEEAGRLTPDQVEASRTALANKGIEVEFVENVQQAWEQFRRLYPEGAIE